MLSSRPLSRLAISASSIETLRGVGFNTVEDILELSEQQLSEQTFLSLEECTLILSAAQGGPSRDAPILGGVLSQSAFSLLNNVYGTRHVRTCEPLDKLLVKCSGGDASNRATGKERVRKSSKENGPKGAWPPGLKKGHVLELSGPPGCSKERVAVMAVGEAVKEGGEVVFVDMQNNTNVDALVDALEDIRSGLERVQYRKCNTLTDLMVFLNNFGSYLDKHERTSLLVLNTLSPVFQPVLSSFKGAQRQALLETIKQLLTKFCTTRNLTIIITTQFATKMHKLDGSPGNFDTASKVVMVPAIADAYLPANCTYRVLVLPDSQVSGVFRLLSRPDMKPSASAEDKLAEEGYIVVGNQVRCRSEDEPQQKPQSI